MDETEMDAWASSGESRERDEEAGKRRTRWPMQDKPVLARASLVA